MRKPLLYSATTFGNAERTWWQKTQNLLESLPESEIRVGAEAEFAAWLSVEQAATIREATQDELSMYLSGSPRKMSIFRDRRPSEEFVEICLQSNSTIMSVRLLEDWASNCSDVPNQKVRTSRNFSAPDSGGRRQEFVAPSELRIAMNEFCRVWGQQNENAENPVAIWLFVALLNAHPFTDGNGRLARSLLNVLLIQRGLLRGKAIPFGPLIYATQGNFELAMGRAAIMNNWAPIMKTFYLLIEFYAGVYTDFERDMIDDRHPKRH